MKLKMMANTTISIFLFSEAGMGAGQVFNWGGEMGLDSKKKSRYGLL